MTCDKDKKFFYIYPKLALPSEIYACDSEDAKDRYKKDHQLKRLPNGFQLWEAPKNQDLGDTNIND